MDSESEENPSEWSIGLLPHSPVAGTNPELPEHIFHDIRIDISENNVDDTSHDVEEMYGNGITVKGPCCKKKCNERIPKEVALKHRHAFQEFSKEEKDIVILSQLQMHRRIPELIKEYNVESKRGRCRMKNEDNFIRRDVKYYFCDIAICKKMYIFLHDIGDKRYKNLVKHYDTIGLTSRTHKLKLKKPTRDSVLSQDHIGAIVKFIQEFAQEYVAPLTDGESGLQNVDTNTIQLPSYLSKRKVYSKYCETDLKRIARSTFMNVWRKHCSHITVEQSATSLKGREQPVVLLEDLEILGP